MTMVTNNNPMMRKRRLVGRDASAIDSDGVERVTDMRFPRFVGRKGRLPGRSCKGDRLEPGLVTGYPWFMVIVSRLVAALMVALLAAWPASAIAGTFVTIPLGSYTGNIQSKLIAPGPLGHITTSDATPFDIPVSGNNFDEVSSNPGLTLWTKVDVANVTDVFTLINAYGPTAGVTIGVITFNFSNGTSRSVDLVGGRNVRDFYHGRYANILSGESVQNAFSYTDTAGGARTGNVRTGMAGGYVIDEQHFPLGTAGVGTTLTSIVITTPYGNRIASGGGQGTPIILGLTVETPSLLSDNHSGSDHIGVLPLFSWK
jgi:hypothetical protein